MSRRSMSGPVPMYFGLIADEETTAGFLLASFGISASRDRDTNYYIVKPGTTNRKIKKYFLKLYANKNIAILLISTDVAKVLGAVLHKANQLLPIVLEIPTKKAVMPLEFPVRKRESLADIALL